MLFTSVLMEYNMLSNRMQQLENTVSTSVETALDVSMASEEFFTENYAEKVSSQTNKLNNRVANAVNKVRVYSKESGSWVEGNAYVMSFFYNDNGRFPNSQSEFDGYENREFNEDYKIYARLFCASPTNVGSDYGSNSLKWANTSRGGKAQAQEINAKTGYTGLRTASQSLKDFYNGVGSKITSKAVVKVPDGDSFKIEEHEFPTLAQMGVDFGGNPNYNSVSSRYVLDNFNSNMHVGKRSGNLETTRYFLTPYSLGVTYVPTEVYKPVFIAHLSQSIRFNKIKTGETTDESFNISSADGFMETSIHPDGGAMVMPGRGTDSGWETLPDDNILNDGYAEYDIGSVKVKVDYSVVDFYDDRNVSIAERILGVTKGIPVGDSEFTDKLKESDTSTGVKDGKRIVARVTTKIKVHLPYISPILQWASYMEAKESNSETHFGIRRWDNATQSISNSDDLWFKYTTYRAISR